MWGKIKKWLEGSFFWFRDFLQDLFVVEYKRFCKEWGPFVMTMVANMATSTMSGDKKFDEVYRITKSEIKNKGQDWADRYLQGLIQSCYIVFRNRLDRGVL